MTYPGTLLKAWQLSPKKQMGQNFLADDGLAEKIIRKSHISDMDTVVEIGPGLGAITLPLLKQARKVIAIEKDTQLIPILRSEILAAGISMDKMDLRHQNILDVDFSQLANEDCGPLVVVGNLPYNISSQILIKLMQARAHVKKAIFMFQKELAERIMAGPGGKTYGRISVAMQYCSDIHRVIEVKANKFFPRPKVDSEVIEIAFRDTLLHRATDESFFLQVVKAAFGRRRKMLKNSLMGSELHLDGDTITKALNTSGIDPVRRAETLTIEEFVRLSNTLEEKISPLP